MAKPATTPDNGNRRVSRRRFQGVRDRLKLRRPAELPAAQPPARPPSRDGDLELAFRGADAQDAGIGSIEASDVAVERSAVGRIRASNVELRQGVSLVALGRDVQVRQGGGAVLAGGRLHVEQSGAQWLIGGLVQAKQVFAITVIAGRIEGQVRCLMDTRGAFAFGAGAALTAGLLRLLLRRR